MNDRIEETKGTEKVKVKGKSLLFFFLPHVRLLSLLLFPFPSQKIPAMVGCPLFVVRKNG
jgi:hypothetical protein